ncbi:MAG: RNA methyltransferase, partial [Nitrospinota bacterium]
MGLETIDIILVEPKYAGNVGAIARSAKNYGVRSIKIVGDIDFLCLEAKKMALYGYPLLEQAARFTTLDEALKTNSLAIDTVHQSRFNRKSLKPPWQVFENLSRRLATEPTALVFGREANGLTREEINLCHFLTIIPTDKNLSFNLAHSVTVFLYEAYRSTTGKEKP